MRAFRTRLALTRLAAVSAAALALFATATPSGHASSHRDAPLALLCPTTDITDVYAFVGERDGERNLNLIMCVTPYLEQGFDSTYVPFNHNATFQIHVDRLDDVAAGRSTVTYCFQFDQAPVTDPRTLASPDEVRSNPFQTYTVTEEVSSPKGKKKKKRKPKPNVLGKQLAVGPPNLGPGTRLYNQNGDGLQPVDPLGSGDLDPYTEQAVHEVDEGIRVFVGQRDDGFYADLARSLARNNAPGSAPPPEDPFAGFNTQGIAIEVPFTSLPEGLQGERSVAVWADVVLPRTRKLSGSGDFQKHKGPLVRVSRAANPLLNKYLVAPSEKDRFNAVHPRDFIGPETRAESLRRVRAFAAPFSGTPNVVLLESIYFPDVLTLNTTTGPARMPGDEGYSPLAGFGGDTLTDDAGGSVPGGWPNGRRLGDDTGGILVRVAVGGILVPTFPAAIDANDVPFLRDFPFLAAPHNPFSHLHHRASPGGGGGGGEGGGEDECVPIDGLGNVPAVTYGIGFFEGEAPVLNPFAGQSYTIRSSAFLQTSIEPGPLQDVRIELIIDGQPVLDQTLPVLELLVDLPDVEYTVPAGATGTICVEVRINGVVDVRVPIQLGP